MAGNSNPHQLARKQRWLKFSAKSAKSDINKVYAQCHNTLGIELSTLLSDVLCLT